MPDEREPHPRTWMAFGASAAVRSRRLLPVMRGNLATIARTIAEFEPVSMLVRAAEVEQARRLIGSESIELILAPRDDLWIRETGPVFVCTTAGAIGGAEIRRATRQQSRVQPPPPRPSRRSSSCPLVDIDDAHCISEGEHDVYPNDRQLSDLVADVARARRGLHRDGANESFLYRRPASDGEGDSAEIV